MNLKQNSIYKRQYDSSANKSKTQIWIYINENKTNWTGKRQHNSVSVCVCNLLWKNVLEVGFRKENSFCTSKSEHLYSRKTYTEVPQVCETSDETIYRIKWRACNYKTRNE